MDFVALTKVLSELTGQTVYMQFKPEILDFTNSSATFEMQFFGPGGKEFIITPTEETFLGILYHLEYILFTKGMKLITWNWKNFVTFVLAKTKKTISVGCSIIDLKIIESYSGIKLSAPKNLTEALNRLKALISSGVWKEVEPIYKKLHLPLMTAVIPHLEAIGVLDDDRKTRVHAYYEIDGQENGRLKCSEVYNLGYVPHAMKPETRQALRPIDDKGLFMLFDYRGQEVYMLAWMSKDPLLQELCRQQDVYLGLYQSIFEKSCETKNDRELAKKIFLPIIYGQQAYSLSQRCNVAIDVAEKIIERIGTLFPVAIAFVESYQKQLQEHGYVKDIFGKRRTKFEEGKEYSARNFAIQSPSAVVCLEKLTNLYFALRNKTNLTYTVHDGYAVYATKENWQTIYKIGYDVLSGESEFCPGLKLKVTCRAGKSLNDLKSIGTKVKI